MLLESCKVVEKKKDDINVHNDLLQKYYQDKNDCIKYIKDYESKNRFQRIFANSGKYNEAKKQLQWLENNIVKTVESINQSKKQLNYYSNVYNETLQLSKRRKELAIVRSLNVILKEINNVNDTLSNLRNDINNIVKQYNLNDERLKNIQEKISNSSDEIKKYRETINQLSELQRNITFLREKCNAINLLYKEHLNNEVSKIEFTCDLNAIKQATDLQRLYEIVKRELDIVDVDKIEVECNDLEEIISEHEKRIKEIDKQLPELEKQIVKNAKIIGATLTKVFIEEELQEKFFDTVIIDEASMASIPAMWCAALLAKKNIVVVGDFLQLSPIVLAETSEAKKWLGTDIFALNGVQELCKNHLKMSGNITKLTTQYRMDENIASIANMYYGDYGGLTTGSKDKKALEYIKEFYDWYKPVWFKEYNVSERKYAITLVNTNSMSAWVNSVPTGWNKTSRVNICSASLCVEMAFSMLPSDISERKNLCDKCTILILSPYRPHADKVKQYIKLKYKSLGLDEHCQLVTSGTIHKFQGTEADIVIVDFVIDQPHFKAGLFSNSEAIKASYRKMFNVAITRAKYKLYAVGNYDFLKGKGKGSALEELIDKLLLSNHIMLDAKKIIPNSNYYVPEGIVSDIKADQIFSCRDEIYFKYLKSDICKCKKYIIIYSPFITVNRLGDILPILHDIIQQGKKVIIITKSLKNRGKKDEQKSYIKMESIIKGQGIEIIHKSCMHEKIVIIDNNIIWHGSLNTLSYTGKTGEIMTRINNSEYVQSTCELMNLNKIINSMEAGELQCPICHEELYLAEGNNGIYWDCNNGDYNRNIDALYPVDGEYICKYCNKPYYFSYEVDGNKKSKPRWVCPKDKRHTKNFSLPDLKLEKMRKKIKTKKDVKNLTKYYNDDDIKINDLSGKKVSPKEFLENLYDVKSNSTKNKSDIGQMSLF